RDTHPGAAVARAAGRGPLGEAAVALVVVEHVPGELVRDVEVRPPVAVVVSPGGRQVPARVADVGASGDVGEGAVAVVPVERVAHAVGGGVVGARHRVLVVPHADDEDVEEAVAIVVRDDRHAGPAAGRDVRRGRHVHEVTATRVVEEAIPSHHGGHVEVGPAVVVVVEEYGACGGRGVG